VKAFADLLDGLLYCPGRNGKLRLLHAYFDAASDPDRGWALAALTGGLSLPGVGPAVIRALVADRVDPDLFRWSYDYVGDLAETVSLIWPDPGATQEAAPTLALSEVVDTLQRTKRQGVPAVLEHWFNLLDPPSRYALIKLMTGGLRVGVSARLAKTALASWRPAATGGDVGVIEELWHGLTPPYTVLFDWLEGRGPRPEIGDALTFRPLMLANPLDGEDPAADGLDPAAYWAETKWDGIRVQLVLGGGEVRLFSRTGDDITAAFPDVPGPLPSAAADAVLDGELLVVRAGEVAPFNDLQQRLGRKTVTVKLQAQYPAHIRLYDILFADGTDLRPLPLQQRRAALEGWLARAQADGALGRCDLSALIPFSDWATLATIRAEARMAAQEGLMLKRRDSAYVAGRPKGPWCKWKRAALTADTVLMYAQRGHGKRSSFYSDFTFGAWGADGVLVPVGKAYSGFTDAELAKLDKWVRANTTDRYGPVRAVTLALVLEVAFDSVHPSTRHKSGLAMRFPRIHRIRWDKPAADADRLEALERLIG
jgi:DNA ligase-1